LATTKAVEEEEAEKARSIGPHEIAEEAAHTWFHSWFWPAPQSVGYSAYVVATISYATALSWRGHGLLLMVMLGSRLSLRFVHESALYSAAAN